MDKKLENIVGRRVMATFDKSNFDKSGVTYLTRLCVVRVVDVEVSPQLLQTKSFVIAVKLSGTRHTVRSAEISLGEGPIHLDQEWRIQYQHSLKNIEMNRMIIMLQRRKTYKNRLILGFKTVASHLISLDEVYQRGFEKQISLLPTVPCHGPIHLSLSVTTYLCTSLSPAENEDDFEDFGKWNNFRQHKLMKKLVKLVRKSRASNIATTDAGQDHSQAIQMIMNELDGISNETPSVALRPRLRPHVFDSSSSSLKSEDDSSSGSWQSPTAENSPPARMRNSICIHRSSSLTNKFFGERELPSCIAVYQIFPENTEMNILNHGLLREENFPEFEQFSGLKCEQIELFLSELMRRLQHISDRSVEEPARVRIALFVCESFMATFIRHYVSLLSVKAPIWTSFFIFYYIPVGDSCIGRLIASRDDCIMGTQGEGSIAKVRTYLSQTVNLIRLPIAEVMIPQLNEQFLPLVAELVLKCGSGQSSSDDENVGKSSKAVRTPDTCDFRGNVGEPGKMHLHVDISFDENKNDIPERLEKLLKKDAGKYTMKIGVTSFVVKNQMVDGNSLTVEFMLADKKPMLRLNKSRDQKQRMLLRIFGVTRLICKTRGHSAITVCVDDLETDNVTFMSVTSQWRTNVKTVPFLAFPGNS